MQARYRVRTRTRRRQSRNRLQDLGVKAGQGRTPALCQCATPDARSFSESPSVNSALVLSLEIAHVDGKPTHIDREIAKAEEFLGQPSPSSRANRHKAAVAASSDLLKWWGRRAHRDARREWARLAGILADNQKVDLLDHMRAYKRRRAPTVEKLLGKHSVLYRTVRR